MSWGYYVSKEFLYASTTNVFNFIALISAILLLLDPILFIVHSGYNYYIAQQSQKPTNEKRKETRANLQSRIPQKVEWWKWYLVSMTIHLLDAWFFRTIVPFFERARSQRDLP